jgi:hypothetical protein
MPLITSDLEFSDDYPTIEPSLRLDFANARALDPRITFTRASTATYVGRDGLIKTAGEDEARFDHDPTTGESLGLLIEESRTNLLPESEDLDTSGLITKLAITTSNDTSVIAPDGTAGATRVIQNTDTAQHLIGDTAAGLTLGGNYALSCFVKAGTTDLIWFSVNSYLNWVDDWNFYINLTTGNVYGNSNNISNANLKVEEYPNGWWRLSMVAQQEPAGSGAGGLWLGHANPNGDNTTNFTGDGSTYFYAWGFQMEAGSFPTSYIPTSGSTATRALEYGYTTNMDFYNQNEGSIFSEVSLLDVGNTSGKAIWSFNVVGGFGEGIYMVNENGGTGINHVLYDNSVSQYSRAVVGSISANQFYKTIYSQQTNNVNSAGDGSVGTDDTSATLPTIGRLVIGNNAWGSSPLTNGLNPSNCHMKSFSYYPKRLTNAQLQTLTQ